jgi:chromosome segregation ATPase
MPSPKGSTRRPARAVAATATPPYESPSLEVLETLEIQNALSNLEARLDSLEIDLARATGTREDDARRIAGEMAVMKARVEDALNAFASTADELRDMARGVEKKLTGVVGAADAEDANAIREELKARIDGVTAGVGDVLESMAADVRARIEVLGGQMKEIQEGMAAMVERVGSFAPHTVRLENAEQPARSTD